MQLRWEWLATQITAPYVPGLGPVPPDAMSAELFSAVADSARSGVLLPYDKDRRWGVGKSERLHPETLVHGPTDTVFATVSSPDTTTVRVYHYGSGFGRTHLSVLGRRVANEVGAADIQIVWFSTSAPADTGIKAVNILLKDFTRHEPAEFKNVVDLAACTTSVQATLRDLAHEPENAGFAFLADKFAAGALGGPVLAVVEQNRVAGAIGPLEIAPSPDGRLTLWPQYFGVPRTYRGKGFGRDLWRAGMDWGATHGAAHQLLQTTAGGASERLCLSEGLTSLGYVCSATA